MKILQVALLCNDLDTIEHFYTHKLQLSVAHKCTESITLKTGRSLLTFRLDKTLQPIYHIAFEIPCNKLLEAMLHFHDIRWVNTSGNTPVIDFKNWNAQSVYFYDDNNNILEFIVRYDNNIRINRPFEARDILNISETGLVAEAPVQLAREFKLLYGIDHYKKQPPKEDFCALGDSEGLLILSGNDRNWFPTETKAVQYPVFIRFEEDGRIFELDYK